MSSDQPWLSRLNEATDYQQLQAVFQELSRAASSSTREVFDINALIDSIDEAIRRIEAERSRDDSELKDFESRYDAFKEQQRGVLGWFRRHLPMTATRRQEREHRDAIADQHAEILADNLVIARAQMLKQRLLPSDERQLGRDLEHWKARLTAAESTRSIADYAAAIEELRSEIAVSTSFVNEIRGQIDAFAEAEFSHSDDRQRQQQDLADARKELASFQAELDGELALQTDALRHAGDLVRDDLMNSDHEFYALTRQMEELEPLRKLARTTASKADAFATCLGRIEQSHRQQQDCLETRERLAADQERLRPELDNAERRLARCKRKLDEASRPHQEAKLAMEKAQAALDAADRIDQKLNPGDAADRLSVEHPVRAECQRLAQDVDQARKQYQIATTEFEDLKAKHDRRNEAYQDLRKRLAEVEVSLEANRRSEESSAVALRSAQADLPEILSELEPNLDAFLKAMEQTELQSHVATLGRKVSWRASLPPRLAGPVRPDHKSVEEFEKLAEALRKDERQVKETLATAQHQRQSRWLRRCREVLGEALAGQIEQL
ncbi:hypothetical protein FYK55_24305 [Roseiconus nitratireducens]|uniref:Uncharacterized protein n=1 Tax=Roseiconus nitratireducens TaxID=2605748 RepID=A0A5M6D1F0_9BACT|nr:hypothetical protein [Roseiconus nitratireducens]KAA5539459.1 hypothetical protein FYK55_24305 [Roseiconus nitratireducens]